MFKPNWCLSVLFLFAQVPLSALAQTIPAPIVSDRPGVYCGTYTIEPGQVQLETGLSLDYDRTAGSTVTFVSTPAVLRIGLVEDLELRVSTAGYSRFEGSEGSVQGLASQSLGLKYRVVDPDEAGAGTTMAFIFNLELPSGSSDFRPPEAVPSLVFAIEQNLAANWSLSANFGIAVPNDPIGEDRLADLVYALAFSRSLGVTSGFFLEFAGNLPQFQELTAQTLIDGGFAWLPSNDVQLDISLARGLSGAGSDWTLAGGVSWRLN